MIARHRRYSQVHLLARHAYLNTPILGQALFRNTHRTTHHLDTRHDRRVELFRVIIYFNELAINTVTYP